MNDASMNTPICLIPALHVLYMYIQPLRARRVHVQYKLMSIYTPLALRERYIKCHAHVHYNSNAHVPLKESA